MKKKFLYSFVALLGMFTIFCAQVLASDDYVEPGNNTLQKAIDAASPGATLKLKKGDYAGDVVINKSITIIGNKDSSTISGKVKIAKDGKSTEDGKLKVVLKGYRSSVGPISYNAERPEEFNNYRYISVETPVDLDLGEIYIYAAARPPQGYSKMNTGPVALYIDAEADNSVINVSSSILSAFYDGISLKSSDTTLNITDNSEIFGRLALNLESGENNTVKIDNSNINGRSHMSENDEAISIHGQKKLNFTINDSKIMGAASEYLEKGEITASIISFDGTAEDNSDVDIKLTGNTVITDEEGNSDSVIFNFGETGIDKNNKIYVENTVQINKADLSTKYNVSDDYAVVGIFDRKGNFTVELYTKQSTITEASGKLPVKKDTDEKGNEYELKRLYYKTKTDSVEKDFTADSTQITENMDIYPEYVKKIKVKIEGTEEVFTLNENDNLAKLKETSNALEALNTLENNAKKKFDKFVDDNGEEVNEEYTFKDSVTIKALYNVEVKIGEDTFTLAEGKKLEDLEELEMVKLITHMVASNKQFSHFVDQEQNTVTIHDEIKENKTLTAKFKVTVTIDSDEFEIEEGKTLKDITDPKFAAKKTVDGKKFKEFVKLAGEEETTITEEEQINENITIAAKFTIKVTIDGTDFDIDEGKAINTNSSALEKLNGLKTKDEEQKRFSHFEAQGDKVDEETLVVKELAIVAKYQVDVTFVQSENNKLKVTLYDGQTIEDLSIVDSLRLSNLKSVEIFGQKWSGYENAETKEPITEKTPFTKHTTINFVYALDPVHIESVTLSEKNITLDKGKNQTLTATINPEKTTDSTTLTWESDHDDIAEVGQDGKVTAKAPGEAQITVRTSNGKTDTCKVKVLSHIESVTLDESDITLNRGTKKKLTATINPSDTTDDKTLTWRSNNNNIQVSSDGTITALALGEAEVTVETTNGKQAKCKVTVKAPIESVTLNATNITLNKGEEKQLTATINPSDTTDDKTLTWESSNDQVVSVTQQGKIKALKDGDAEITVRTKNGKEAKANVSVVLKAPSVSYRTHVQSIGWQKYVKDGATAGTSGKSLRLEALDMNLNSPSYSGSIEYRTHVQNIGWQDFVSNGSISGTSGKALRLEAVQIKLTGDVASHYDVYYRVHAEHFGWLGWAKNGESAGTATYGYRLEALEVVLVKKGDKVPTSTKPAFVQRTLSYQTHIQKQGWQSNKYDGEVSGTSGKALRLEGVKIKLPGKAYSGSIEYRTHVQKIGWEKTWAKDGQMSGTSGKSLRLEAIQIRLTGEMEKHYDVYYRVHAQHFGWMGWAKNGESAGTAKYSYRLEALQVVLVKKGDKAPGDTKNAFRQK